MGFGENEESVAQPTSSMPALSFTTTTTSTRASPLSSVPSSKSREGLALVLFSRRWSCSLGVGPTAYLIHWRLTTLFPSALCLTKVKSRDWVQAFLLIEWKSLEESSRAVEFWGSVEAIWAV